MNRPATVALRLALALLVLIPALGSSAAAAQAPLPVIIYQTEFEFSEGYRTSRDLAGQKDWTIDGQDGNGILTNAIPGQGQQAYIGFSTNRATFEHANLFQPINFNPLQSGLPIVRFTVLLNIQDSSTANRDSFRWSIYATNAAAGAVRLFTLDFDNHTQNICYNLEASTDFVPTPYSFANQTTYRLELILNFARNRWSALLDNTEIVTLQPITTQNTPLNLADIDAVRYLRNTNAPGDNYMIFDNYSVSAEPIANTDPVLQPLTYPPSGQFKFLAFVEPLVRHTLETSDDLRQWRILATHISPDPTFEFADTTAIPGHPARFYRIRSFNP